MGYYLRIGTGSIIAAILFIPLLIFMTIFIPVLIVVVLLIASAVGVAAVLASGAKKLGKGSGNGETGAARKGKVIDAEYRVK